MTYTITKDQMEKIGNDVAAILMPFCDTIYGVPKDKTKPAKFLGSSILIKNSDSLFILTAQHVAENASKYYHIFHGKTKYGIMFPTQGGWVGCPILDSDIAILGCFEEMFEGTSAKFLNVAKIQDSNLNHEAFFFCLGFPGQLHVSLPFLKTYEATSLPFIGKFKKIINNRNNEPVAFSIEYPSDVNPRGMSGSAVWNLNLHKLSKFKDWNANQITFAGIAQKWVPTSKELIVTNAHIINNYINQMIKLFQETFPRSDK